MLYCQGCHLSDGAGSLKAEVPKMKDYVGNFLKVPEGREYLVRVPGSANAPIGDEKLANLLNWILLTIAGESVAKGIYALYRQGSRGVASKKSDECCYPTIEPHRKTLQNTN